MTATASATRSRRPASPRRRVGTARYRNALAGACGVLVVVGVEEVLTRTGAIPAEYLPPFGEIVRALRTQLVDPTFWEALGQTLSGWAIGLLIAMVLGVVLGIAIGSVRIVRELTASTIEFLRPIPSVALIPLVVLMFGTKPASAILLVVYASFWQVLVQVLYGVTDVDPVARDTARSFRFSRLRVARTVVWPTALPYLMGNVFVDTCVYHQAGIDLLLRVLEPVNVLFGSEMVGAVRGIDPTTGHYFDDTRRYVEAADLDDGARAAVYAGNALRVYPGLSARVP